MRNCLVLGSGRSGTSMLAGVLSGAGFYMGSELLPIDFGGQPGRQTNPKGTFEDRSVNSINEDLLEPLFPRWRLPVARSWARRRTLQRGLRWASALPPSVEVRSRPDVDERIAEHVSHEPFCFKDPRFCYTLPAWRPHLRDAVLLCVFREPERTANSIVVEWQRHPERRFAMTYDRALASWRAMYGRVLGLHRHSGEWVFLHYDQILDRSGLERLEAVLGAKVDGDFPDAGLKRTPADGPLLPEDRAMYEELCRLARAGASTARK